MSYGRKPTGGAANGMAAKRIKKEIADLAKENLGAITLTPNESNIFQWKATLPGPAGSPYEGGVFEVDIRIPEDYPFSPPHLHFVTKLYHCNVASTGAICLDLLKTAWSPALSLYKVILSLSSLLTDPNPADPLVPAIAQEYKRNRQKHDETARQWTRQYALPKAPATAAPAAPTPEPARTSAPRPRPISRPGSSSVVPTQLAGTRRRHAQTNGSGGGGGGGSSSRPIDLASDSEPEPELGNSSDIEVLGETSRNGAISGTSSSRARDARGSKRARIGGANDDTGGVGGGGGGSGAGGSSDDVIVIDE